MNQQALLQEAQSNILIKLLLSDANMKNQLMLNQSPQLAEDLMHKKLKSIGLNDKEVGVIIMRDGLKYDAQKAMAESGLTKDQLDAISDTAQSKITNFLNGGSVSLSSNIRALFNTSNNNE